MPAELHATEVALLALGVLLLASVILGGISSRFGVPVLVLFLVLGMLAGSEGVGHIAFDDYPLTYLVGTVALVLILFDGGLRTPLALVRSGIGPATALATIGVVVTAGLVGVGAHLLGFGWTEGFLLGAIVASTDAAAVFSVLRAGGVRLNERVGAVVELESGLNDPMAVLITTALVSASSEGRTLGVASLLGRIAEQLVVGGVAGAAIGLAANALVSRIHLGVRALYPVLTLSVGFIAFGCASMVHGSGLLAVYVAGVALGNARLPARAMVMRAHDFVAWTGQIVMFVMLGLLVSPSEILAVAPTALVLAALLAFFARPLAVALCLAPFRFRGREILLVGWVGLRGAVPIILAVIPVLGGVRRAETIFNVVFFVVLVSALLQGGTTPALTRFLKLGGRAPPRPAALVEIESAYPLDDEILSFFIAPASAVCGAQLSDIPFPEQSFAMMIVRGTSLVPPKGDAALLEGDHVFVFCPRAEVTTIRLLFGGGDE